MLISYYTLPVTASLSAWSWQETTCNIYSADTRRTEATVRHSKVETIRAVVRYGYQVNGHEYSSDRYNLNDGVVDDVSERVAKLEPGARVRCYFNPDEPSQAILEREGVMAPLGAFLIQMFLFLGITSFLDGLSELEREKPRPFVRATFWTALSVTFAASVIGFGLSVFAGAPIWAWLISCCLPFLLYAGRRFTYGRFDGRRRPRPML